MGHPWKTLRRADNFSKSSCGLWFNALTRRDRWRGDDSSGELIPERLDGDLIASMLTKCLVTPLKLAKQLEWNSRLGKLGAIMCIDISNHQVGAGV